MRARYRFVHLAHRDLVVGKHARERRADFIHRLARQDAAIHGGARNLRQRIVGVAPFQHGRDASGAELSVVERVCRQSLE